MKLAGIDNSKFSSILYRGSGLSIAFSHGANIKQTIKAGSWTNTDTFKGHYFVPEMIKSGQNQSKPIRRVTIVYIIMKFLLLLLLLFSFDLK